MGGFAAEIAYLRGQRLGRLATVNAAGEPHVAQIAFRYNCVSQSYRFRTHRFPRWEFPL